MGTVRSCITETVGMIRALAVCLILGVVSCGWVDLYKFPWTDVPLALMLDVGCTKEGTCFVPGSTGSQAEAVWKTKDDWKTMNKTTMNEDALMLLAIAMHASEGVVGGIGALKLPGILYTKDAGDTWSASHDIALIQTQDVIAVTGGGANEYGWVGSLDALLNTEGVETSTTGQRWSKHPWSKELVAKLPTNCAIRYAAFPTTETIYATCGSWPGNNTRLRVDANQKHAEFDISSRWTVHRHNIGEKNEKMYLDSRLAPAVRAPRANNGYTAGIASSTDGGKTWSVDYTETDAFYFNDICCFTTTNCFAAGEGFANDGSTKPGARILQTSDGKTWTQSTLVPSASALRCVATSATEGWVAVSQQSSPIKTMYYHSTDAGKTWTVDSTVSGVGEVMGMAFVAGSTTVGYAVGITELKITTPMKYNA